ncbi:hypothetical protein MNV_2030027 [Candidatus Methanoperedens nitroreducens]|uniref:Uncharacterized protein n=1 Tax=Candidatus Methanoperedens nitratireducens TaxID=1392998 RepID=A0A284VNF9_9EURY|nr:hypothetical protein MNV_2030027 [Candidatus Methanoperedens nitroreducens]
MLKIRCAAEFEDVDAGGGRFFATLRRDMVYIVIMDRYEFCLGRKAKKTFCRNS